MFISIKISGNSACLGSENPGMLFFMLMNVKMPTLVGILTFMGRKVPCSAELSMNFLTPGTDVPAHVCTCYVCTYI